MNSNHRIGRLIGIVGGDCGNGGAEIVNAAAEGVQAAKRIHELLSH